MIKADEVLLKESRLNSLESDDLHGILKFHVIDINVTHRRIEVSVTVGVKEVVASK